MIERSATAWEGFDAAALADRWGCPAVHLFASLGSTSDAARRLAQARAADGTVVLAEEQVAGRGRAGRSWNSTAGLGLWFSVIAPASDPRGPGVLPLRVGLATVLALEGFVPPGRLGIKWPNDLIAGGSKLGGILCESSWDGARPGRVTVGIGINLLQTEGDFPPELRGGATSLRMHAGDPPSRRAVADAVIPGVLAALGIGSDRCSVGDVRGAGTEAFSFGTGPELSGTELAALGERDTLRGRSVIISDAMSGAPITRGTAAGIRPDGALTIVDDHGLEVPILSGTVRLQHPTDC